MQTCSVLVAVGGSNDTVVLKEGVTVPEVLVLMAGHGRHSITRVPKTSGTIDDVSAKEECSRLTLCYGEETVAIAFGANRFNLTLPTKFEDIDFKEVDPFAGISTPAAEAEPEAEEAEEAPAPKKVKKAVTPFDA
jgi:hypothetical protein